jgi:hypothetical protein
MEHPVFGTLEYGEYSPHWTCQLPVPACLSRAGGEAVFYLSILAEQQQPPSAEAAALWRELNERPALFSQFLERAIFAAYQRDLPHYRRMGDAPDLTEPEQIWQHVGLHTNVIRQAETGDAQLVVGLTTTWRREYGMDLVFRAGQLGVGEGLTPWDELLHLDLPP